MGTNHAAQELLIAGKKAYQRLSIIYGVVSIATIFLLIMSFGLATLIPQTAYASLISVLVDFPYIMAAAVMARIFSVNLGKRVVELAKIQANELPSFAKKIAQHTTILKVLGLVGLGYLAFDTAMTLSSVLFYISPDPLMVQIQLSAVAGNLVAAIPASLAYFLSRRLSKISALLSDTEYPVQK